MGLYKDGRSRCFWANPKNERYIRYHDGGSRYTMIKSCLKC